ncbi:MAG: GNAT family N-acetyltransferase [Pseudomonadota bacterium]
MKLREATVADVQQITQLLADDELGQSRERPGDPVYFAAFARMAEQPGNVILVAEEVATVIGCLQYTLIHGLSRKGGSRAQIEGVRVHAAHRGKRIGEKLVQAAIDRAQGDGAKLVQLTTDVSREEAKRFYERLGFEPTHWGMKLSL